MKNKTLSPTEDYVTPFIKIHPEYSEPLTMEDTDLVQIIKNEYPKISKDELNELIKDVKEKIKDISKNNEYMKLIIEGSITEHVEKLDGAEIESIVITTNKEIFSVPKIGNIYQQLLTTTKRLIRKYQNELELKQKMFDNLSVDHPFMLIEKAINKTSLGPQQKRVVIGMILVHLKLWKHTPIMTEQEFENSPIVGKYKRYLSDIVKSLQKKYS